MNSEQYTAQATGHLAPCPDTPNCVNSEQRVGKTSIAPLQIHGSPSGSWLTLQRALQERGGRIESVSDTFLHATFRTRIFRFVDDVTCRLDQVAGVIHIRSSSRIGYSDLGTNRRRVEEVRRVYETLFRVDDSGAQTPDK